MENRLKTLIAIAKGLPEDRLEDAIRKLNEIKHESEREEDPGSEVECPKCGGVHVVRNGRKHSKQQYLCKDCRCSFVETSGSAVSHSHSRKAVWKQVIRDTMDGVAIDKTAEELDLHHETVFNMRHKILRHLERAAAIDASRLAGVCEADETYILESVKGKKIPEGYHRKPRKHGAVASKPGISNEYICVCAAVEREGAAFSTSVNRATPSKAELLEVFGDRVTTDTLLLSDGAKNYEVLSERGKCITAAASHGLNNINTVNGYHSFIKERVRQARGFSTKYLNRYNSLFSTVFRASETLVEDVYNAMLSRSAGFVSIRDTQNRNLLEL